MGKLLSGRYGAEPDAESIALSLKECNQKLNLKPSDFVSEGPPKFFEKAFGASGRYLLFLADAEDIQGNPIWKTGYYLLPLEAKDVLSALERHKNAGSPGQTVLPIEWDRESTAPEDIKEKAMEWAVASQPLFFICICKQLELRLYPPWALRNRWKARLRCPKRCQPALTTLL
jgi:hypothetical protein